MTVKDNRSVDRRVWDTAIDLILGAFAYDQNGIGGLVTLFMAIIVVELLMDRWRQRNELRG